MIDSIQDVRMNGRRMHVSVRPGVGTPLLVCNGIGASLELLQPFVDALDPEIPVIRFDIPGVGGSDMPRLPYTLASMSLRLSTLLDDLGVDDVDVLGISWGGALAQQFALQNPERCTRLVLVSTAPGFTMVPGSPRVLSKMVTPRRYTQPDFAAAIAGTIYGGRMRDAPQLIRKLMRGPSPSTARDGYFLQLLAGAAWTSLPFLQLIRQPTLILAGDDDPIVPLVNAKMMARLIPNATLHVYGDGHLGLITSSEELAPVIAEFLR